MSGRQILIARKLNGAYLESSAARLEAAMGPRMGRRGGGSGDNIRADGLNRLTRIGA